MLRSVLIFIAGVAVSMGAGWYALPQILYAEKPQPFVFNHAAHTDEKKAAMSCEDCHSLSSNGRFSGIPVLESCAVCHSEAIGDTAAERVFVENYVKKEREPQWHVYSRQPDNAWFSHATHLKLAKLPCEQCHGSHGKSSALPVYRENRITGYSETVMGRQLGFKREGGMRMDDCVACHHSRGLKHSCLDCHK